MGARAGTTDSSGGGEGEGVCCAGKFTCLSATFPTTTHA